MYDHRFLFEAGNWQGEGTIRFSLTENALSYHTFWHVHGLQDNVILATQRVQIVGSDEEVVNRLRVSEIGTEKFLMGLENPVLGAAMGTGLVDQQRVAWEFRGKQASFEGFEIYEKDPSGYLVKAEYASKDDSRTMIEGRLWRIELSS